MSSSSWRMDLGVTQSALDSEGLSVVAAQKSS